MGEGQISPSTCPEGYHGYSYRECVDGQLGEVKTDKCDYKAPSNLQYDNNNNIELLLCPKVSSGVSTYKNIITEFYMQDNTPLPKGLKIDSKTGEISGRPDAVMDTTAFTVRGKNPVGETFVPITISVQRGSCHPKGSASVTLELKVDNAMSTNYDHMVDKIRRIVSEDMNIDATSVVVNIKNRPTVFTPSQKFLSYSTIRQHKSRSNYAVRNKDEN